MTKLELLQAIGNEVCEECGPDADCGEDTEDCGRIAIAMHTLNQFLHQSTQEG